MIKTALLMNVMRFNILLGQLINIFGIDLLDLLKRCASTADENFGSAPEHEPAEHSEDYAHQGSLLGILFFSEIVAQSKEEAKRRQADRNEVSPALGFGGNPLLVNILQGIGHQKIDINLRVVLGQLRVFLELLLD